MKRRGPQHHCPQFHAKTAFAWCASRRWGLTSQDGHLLQEVGHILRRAGEAGGGKKLRPRIDPHTALQHHKRTLRGGQEKPRSSKKGSTISLGPWKMILPALSICTAIGRNRAAQTTGSSMLPTEHGSTEGRQRAAGGLDAHHDIVKQRDGLPAEQHKGAEATFSSHITVPSPALPNPKARTDGQQRHAASAATHGVGCSSAISWQMPRVCDMTRIDRTMS